MKYIFCAVLALASLSACKPAVQQSNATEETTESQTIKAHFVCEDQTTLDVTFDNRNNTAIIHSGEVDSILEGQPIASGYHYMNSKLNLRGKGKDAQYSIGRRAPITCSEE